MSIDGTNNTNVTSASTAASANANAQRGNANAGTPGEFAALMQDVSRQTDASPASPGSNDKTQSKDPLASSSSDVQAQPGANGPADASVAAAAAHMAGAAGSAQAAQQDAKVSKAMNTSGGDAKRGLAAAALQAAQTSANQPSTGLPAGNSALFGQAAVLQRLADANGFGQASGAGAQDPSGWMGSTASEGGIAATNALMNALQSATNGGSTANASAQAVVPLTLQLAGISDGTSPNKDRLTGNADTSRLPDTAGVAVMGADVSATSGATQLPAVAPDPGATTEMRLAQQVTYWVGQGAHSAKLEVDGIDEKPIQINISVQGQEARVNFQTDQLQTQQILQNSVPHLRDLLHREGMVLSDVTVGQSGAGSANGAGNGAGAFGQNQGDRSNARQARILVPDAKVSAASARGVGSGSALDLFV